MKLFVFGIGGTGARVLRSLTMLLAAGVRLDQNTEIIPIIVDMDTANGDTNRTKRLINNYRDIRSKAYSQNPDEGFFYPDLKTLASYKATNFKGNLKDSFQLDFGGIDETFYRYIHGDQLDNIDENLLNALFDNSQPPPNGVKGTSPTELHLKLSMGFKGNPNIGSIVFNNLIYTDEFRYFEDICDEKDKVFIISSIFGGTGSAGFPQLVKNIRNSDKAAVKNVQIGALIVMPYFKISTDREESVIDMHNFNSKTKAALSYYSTELDDQVNDTYYLGCNETGDSYENHEGGESQKNKAHLIELLGASSVTHFARLNTSNMAGADHSRFGYNYYEYGIKNEPRSLDFSHFYPPEHENLMALTTFTYFAKFIRDHITDKKTLNSAFAKNLNLKASLFDVDHFYSVLKGFIVDEYFPWLDELEKNIPSFSPYNLHEGYKRLVKKKEIKLSERYFIQEISKYENRYSTVTSDYERFMKSAYCACKDAIEKRLVHLPA